MCVFVVLFLLLIFCVYITRDFRSMCRETVIYDEVYCVSDKTRSGQWKVMLSHHLCVKGSNLSVSQLIEMVWCLLSDKVLREILCLISTVHWSQNMSLILCVPQVQR